MNTFAPPESHALDRQHNQATQDNCTPLSAEHEDLPRQIEGLRQWWSETAQLGVPKFGEMAARVKVFRGRLESHFALEERRGYLVAPRQVAAQLARQAAELQRDHADLLVHLNCLIERLHGRSTPYTPITDWNQAHDALEEFLLRLARHEQNEEKFLQVTVAGNEGWQEQGSWDPELAPWANQDPHHPKSINNRQHS